MEDVGILNIDDPLHLFSLHYVYVPRINESLKQFESAWNNHPLSSVRNLSPNQLWLTGYHPDICDDEVSLDHFGLDRNGPLTCDNDGVVCVDPPDVPLTSDDYEQLCIGKLILLSKVLSIWVRCVCKDDSICVQPLV